LDPKTQDYLCESDLEGTTGEITDYLCLRGSPVVPCKLELAEEKSKLAQLGQQNGFGPAFLHSLF